MAGKELVIEEANCRELRNYLYNQGIEMENIIDQYITILQTISRSGIISGDVSNALQAYIGYAGEMKGQIGKISEATKNHIDAFLREIENIDKLTF